MMATALAGASQLKLFSPQIHAGHDPSRHCGQGKRLRRLRPLHSTIERTRSTRVVLATCHRDHDPTNNDAENLAAFCQRCHILHDKAEHLRRRRLTYLARRALGDLFTGPYSFL